MKDFTTTILGCGSASPSPRHNPSCQVVQHNGHLFMIDCGEGSQLQMQRWKIKMGMLRHIFITHLHGDHMLGLPGLLSTMALQDVGGDVHVYMPAEGIDWMREFARISRHQHGDLNIMYHPVEPRQEVILDTERLTVETFALHHGVTCVGYIFREKPKPRHIIGDMVEFHHVPHYKRAEIKLGADFVKPDGTVIPNVMLTRDPDPQRSYAYCSDTTFSERTIEAVAGVSTLYHEATYTDELATQARDRGHSTATQAAIVARRAGVEKLILGHFSKKYLSEDQHLAEALREFPNVIIAREGMTIEI